MKTLFINANLAKAGRKRFASGNKNSYYVILNAAQRSEESLLQAVILNETEWSEESL